MLFLVVAFVVLAMVVGSAMYLPWPVTLVAALIVLTWLAVFAVKERHRRAATRGA
ncbi:hypothetical protein [Streptomyces malaysiense]|uniref:hypothetical protein n=1 Tax=Streptomyces malaysiense TaxID=1428626 RepID=UPI0006212E11|nr:hypothetical protein [Streptomyces malaysiense]